MDTDSAGGNFLSRLNKILDCGWQAKLNQDGRLYYLNHDDETSHWIPPRSNWPQLGELPYGWEAARDKKGKEYYINHRTCTTTREDPFDLEEAPPEQRDVVLVRDAALGFGFIAGSEKPVVIRSVTEGGPSIDKLLPGDEILKVNGEDVKNSDRQYIIDKIRYSTDQIELSVIQPYIDKTGLKSSFLSATKKQKLKAKPPRVRFAENVNTFPSNSPKIPPSLVYLPNVLKVYLENGQTKSFKYDNDTTVKEVLENLRDKLDLKCLEYFSLVVGDVRIPSQHKFIILQEHEALRQIADRPGSQNWKCMLRVTYVPCDAYDLHTEDPNAFEYFYQQCCNDVLQGCFSSELKPETAVRLASLHIHQHLLASKQTTKMTIKAIEKEDGLERFLPETVLTCYKAKDLRKLLSHHMKQNQNLPAPGQKTLRELQAKLHYLKIVGDLKSLGTRRFNTTILDYPDVDQQSDATVIVGPRCDVSLLAKTGHQALVLEFNQLTRLLLTVESGTEDGVHRLELHQKSGQPIVFLLPTDDALQMATFISGYYKLLVNRQRTLLSETSVCSLTSKKEAPPYCSRHLVHKTKWNYPDDLASEVIVEEDEDDSTSGEVKGQEKRREGDHWVDLSTGPPPYSPPHTDIKRVKMADRLQEELDSPNADDGEGTDEASLASDQDLKIEGKMETWQDDVGDGIESLPGSEDNSQSEEKSSGHDEDAASPVLAEISSLLSNGMPSPDSDTKVSGLKSKLGIEVLKKKSPKSTEGKKREKSLTEGISKKIFRSITGMKFNVRDTVATNDSDNVSGTDLKLLRSSPLHESSMQEGETDDRNATESSPQDGEPERPNSRLRARDSILVQHRKRSPRLKRRRDSDESDDSLQDVEGHSKSIDSDVIDLTGVGDYDFDSDLSRSGSLPGSGDSQGDEDVFIENGVDIEADVECRANSIDDDDVTLDIKVNLSGSSDGASDAEDNQAVKSDDDDDDDDEVVLPDESMEHIKVHDESDTELRVGVEDDRDIGEEDDVPVSMIDMPSPEPTLRSPLDVSDEAHGMQLAALVALSASMEEVDQPRQAAAKGPDIECESDSGNETISSEIDNNNVDHVGMSPSPRDYAHMSRVTAPYSLQSSMELDDSSAPFLKDEEAFEPGSAAAFCATSSDNESTSTLHGSSPNLTAIDAAEDNTLSPAPRDFNNIDLSSLEPAEVSTPGEGDDIEALIASLAIAPPPPMDTGEIDEELLQAILPPPTFEGFDEGVIEEVLPQSLVDGAEESDTDENLPECNIGSSGESGDHGSLEQPSSPPGADLCEPDNEMIGHDTSENLLTHSKEMPISTQDFEDQAITPPAACEDVSSGDIDGEVHDGFDALRDEERICHTEEEEIQDESVIEDIDEDAGLRELLELSMTPEKECDIPDGSERNDTRQDALSPTDDILELLTETSGTEHLDGKSLLGENATSLENSQRGSMSPKSPSSEDGDNDLENLEVHYDSYGRLRGQQSPEQKVANILDAIILGSIPQQSPMVSSPAASTPSIGDPTSSPMETEPKLRGIQQSKLQGSVDSGFHQPDPDQLSLTSPSEFSSSSSTDSGFPRVDAKEDSSIYAFSKAPNLQLSGEQETIKKPEPSRVTKPKILGPKPAVPPKPSRPKDLNLKFNAHVANAASEKPLPKHRKYSAPQAPPPQPPPRKRYKAPGIAAKASRFEGQGDSELGDGFSTLPKSFSPQIPSDFDFTDREEAAATLSVEAKVQPDLADVSQKDGPEGSESPGSKDRHSKSKQLARSHTFSESSPTKESGKLYPSRKAPPPPLPKPKLKEAAGKSPSATSSKLKVSSSASNSPQGSVSKKPSFSGSLSKLLSPHRSRTWGQFKDSLPFKQGSFKGSVSSTRSKSKTRKPLKALWPSATCDDAGDGDSSQTPEEQNGVHASVARVSANGFQRSESLDIETRPTSDVDTRVRSFSLNMMKSASLDSASDSDFDTPQGSPNLSQNGTLRGRPSSLISLTESYPPALGNPKRPPPPRPTKAPVTKAASLSRLSTRVCMPLSPTSPEPLPSPSSSMEIDMSAESPSPPPLPSSEPPVFGGPERDRTEPSDEDSHENQDHEASAMDVIMAIESKEYAGVTAISSAMADITLLAEDMGRSISSMESQPNARSFRQAKDALLSEVREFTSNTKMVVSAAGQGGEQLRESTNSSMHTLARLCSATQAAMTVMTSATQAQNLGKKVEDVARNFSTTLQAANEAHGRPLGDPKMQQLLRKAQTMAALLSALMRSLRILQH
ncbi:uncharacterized protein [Diadema setosum]|uniref:uncharacterized protein n=1 Tax=Diadema setosum TaxID=31175 RepID=UPI003B3A0A01